MRHLSNKRKFNASLFGEAIARRFLNDYVKNPEWFPKGLESLPEIARNIARVELFAHCTWEPTSEEERLAGEVAERGVEIALAVAKIFAKMRGSI